VGDILVVHKQFNKRLRDLEEEDPVIGELYTNFIPSLSVYEKYVLDYPKSLQTREECTKHTEYTDFLMACHKEAGEALDTLLGLIYTRVPQIGVLLQHLVEATEPAHTDKNTLGLAVRQIETTIDNIKKLKHPTDSK